MLLPSVTNERFTMDESTARSCHSNSIGQAFLWALLPTFLLVFNASLSGSFTFWILSYPSGPY